MRFKLNDIMNAQMHDKQLMYTKQKNHRTTEEILDSIDFSEIERYVRNKKLNNINNEQH